MLRRVVPLDHQDYAMGEGGAEGGGGARGPRGRGGDGGGGERGPANGFIAAGRNVLLLLVGKSALYNLLLTTCNFRFVIRPRLTQGMFVTPRQYELNIYVSNIDYGRGTVVLGTAGLNCLVEMGVTPAPTPLSI